MPAITIGQSQHGKPVNIDLGTLVSTRLLIQANSGGGKSWAIRRLVEQAFGHVQQIVIDPEGEFATLRERFGFVLVGPGGETPADPRSAALVAEKLLELNASAVCDIYELKAPQRHAWVRTFLDAMINAPKKLWHPCLVIVDESHTFCPEKGMGESEATGAMTDLCTRGRKRGYTAVFATQRLGKLSKNASAELQNRLIGPTFEDIDRKRAAELLGVIKSDEREFFKQIQLLAPGNFFGLGRAISFDRVLLKVGSIHTSHPQAGAKITAPPPTPEAIAKLLPKLEDLPKAAQERAATEQELRRQLSERDRRIRELERTPQTKPSDPQADQHRIQVAVEKAVSSAIGAQKKFFDAQVRSFVTALSQTIPELAKQHFTPNGFHPTPVEIPRQTATHERIASQHTPLVVSIEPSAVRLSSAGSPGWKRMLIALAQSKSLSLRQLGLRAGLSSKSGTFATYLSSLRKEGYIEGSGNNIAITDSGLRALGSYDPLPTGPDLLRYWQKELGGGSGAARILQTLAYASRPLTHEEIGDRAGLSHTSGTYATYLSKLRTLELISGSRELTLSDDLR